MRVTLSAVAAQSARGEAQRHGIPTELWVRLAVDAARHVSYLADEAGLGIDELHAEMDQAACRRWVTQTLHAAATHAYARRLRAGVDRPYGPAACSLTLMLPDQLMTAWTSEAARCALSLSRWIEEMIPCSPRGAPLWDAAAAERGLSLGEWILRRALGLPRERCSTSHSLHAD